MGTNKKCLIFYVIAVMALSFGGIVNAADSDPVSGATSVINSYKAIDSLVKKLNEILASPDDRVKNLEGLRIKANQLKGRYSSSENFEKNINTFNNQLVEMIKNPDPHAPMEELSNRMKKTEQIERQHQGSSSMRKALTKGELNQMQAEVDKVLEELTAKVESLKPKEEESQT